MIDVRDLRIGNYVTYEGETGCVAEITATSIDFSYRTKYGSLITILGAPFQDLKPIPLTEEILLKCGFEKINQINRYTFYSYSRKKREKDRFFCEIYERWTKIGGSMIEQHIQYLHQLQNVYFSLVGEEMEVNI